VQTRAWGRITAIGSWALQITLQMKSSAMRILRKIRYTVGEACNFDAEPFVAVAGQLRTSEDGFKMVADYNCKRA
jgi:hypothetical protein